MLYALVATSFQTPQSTLLLCESGDGGVERLVTPETVGEKKKRGTVFASIVREKIRGKGTGTVLDSSTKGKSR